MTVDQRQTTFRNVLAKGPKRRPSRSSSGNRAGGFVLYVEGARDREILGCWARRVDSALTRCIEKNTVILGGRRPARAIEDFRKRGGVAAGYSGLIVLDRDDHPHAATAPRLHEANGASRSSSSTNAAATASVDRTITRPAESNDAATEAGLEVFVWSLRHIESYLLVPETIRRMLGLDADDRRVERSIEASMTLQASLHAKRTLGSGGSLSEALGTELRAGEIARAMRPDELHGDVRTLFDRIGRLSGLSKAGPEVVIRS